MGKAGRFACIFVPMALTIASLICLILVFSGQTNKNMSVPNQLYFFKADLSDVNWSPDKEALDKVKGVDDQFDGKLLAAIQGDNLDGVGDTTVADDIAAFYQVGLWNYCEGKVDNGKEKVTECSKRKSNFWFNPIEVWGLKNSTVQDVLGDKMNDGLNAYHKAAKWMFSAYVIAICLTAAEFVVGIFAIFSRWGSFVTTIVSTAQTVFILAAAATSTAIYSILTGAFNTALKPYNIKASMSTKMLSVVWLGVAFSVASGFFWLISVCCCSGKSGHKKVVVEKTPYTYERVASPYLGARDGGHQLHNMPASGHSTSGSAYEPFRHNNV